jgi:uridine kinase
VHGDDFYRPMAEEDRLLLSPEDGYDQYFDWQRLRDEVLIPLASGTAGQYQRYDWPTGALAAGELHHAPRSGIVIVEGVYTARPELAGYYDLTVWVDTPREICMRRLDERGDDHGPGNWNERWRAAEEHYLAATRPASRLDLTVRGC